MIEAGMTSEPIREALDRKAQKERFHNLSALDGIVEPEIRIPVSENEYILMSGITGIRTDMRENREKEDVPNK